MSSCKVGAKAGRSSPRANAAGMQPTSYLPDVVGHSAVDFPSPLALDVLSSRSVHVTCGACRWLARGATTGGLEAQSCDAPQFEFASQLERHRCFLLTTNRKNGFLSRRSADCTQDRAKFRAKTSLIRHHHHQDRQANHQDPGRKVRGQKHPEVDQWVYILILCLFRSSLGGTSEPERPTTSTHS